MQVNVVEGQMGFEPIRQVSTVELLTRSSTSSLRAHSLG